VKQYEIDLNTFAPTIVLCRIAHDTSLDVYLRNDAGKYGMMRIENTVELTDFTAYESIDQLKQSIPPADFRNFLYKCAENELLPLDERVDFRFTLSILNEKEHSQ
jgi:hypothetical protein